MLRDSFLYEYVTEAKFINISIFTEEDNKIDFFQNEKQR